MSTDRKYLDQMTELAGLQDEWERVFGEELRIGFGIGPDQIPLIRRCLRERDRSPLDAYIRGAVAQDIHF